MQYLGGKARIAKKIVEVINRYEFSIYYEPFLGGCNILPLIDSRKERYGRDINQDIMMFYTGLQNGMTLPKTVTGRDYYALKTQSSPSALRGFVGMTCAFAGAWFAGYARSGTRNFATNGYNVAMKLQPLIQTATFSYGPYNEGIEYKPGSLIYCDPPYKGSTAYKFQFSHDEFWDWVREISKDCIVLVSEYSAPEDFECIWEFEHRLNVQTNKDPKRIEKIFKLKT